MMVHGHGSGVCGVVLAVILGLGTGCSDGVGVAGNSNANDNGNDGDGGVDPLCGNGMVEPGEDCDGADHNGLTCTSLGLGPGVLACRTDCTVDVSGCESAPDCGNGIVDYPEACDGADLGGETCESRGFGGGTLVCDGACELDESGCLAPICGPVSPSNPDGRPALQTFVHPSVSLQLAVVEEATVTDAGPSDAGANEAAVTFDVDLAGRELAGFALSRSAVAGTPRAEVNAVINTLAAAGFATLDIRTPGVAIVSHEGHPTVASTVLLVSSGFSQDIAQVRNTVVANLLGRSTAVFSFPGFIGHAGTQFVVAFATQQRGGMALLMGAVALVSDVQAGTEVALGLADAANSTGLAESTATVTGECQNEVLADLPMADIIWVLDDSGSMYDERANIANNAANFYNFAGTYSLDFRMGVLNMEENGGGVFCTADDALGDFFLTPSDLTDFQACVLEPWGVGGSANEEYGVTQGYSAIVNHLPRAALPNRIRPDARLNLIFVSDEAAQEVKDQCTQPWDPTCVAGVLAPTVGLLQGTTDPEGIGRAHAITQPPPLGCSAGFSEPGTGYLELAQATGGQVHSICEADLGPAMLRILEGIIAGATPVVLTHVPISASLAVAMEDKSTNPSTMERLDRSRTFGFDYRVGPNGLVFIGQDLSQLPYDLILSYDRWQ